MDDKEKAVQAKTKGNTAFSSEQYDEALVFYSQAIDLDPSVPSFYTNRAAVFLKMNRGDEALKDANKSLDLDSTWIKGHIRKALALIALGKHDGAKSFLDKSLRTYPDNQLLQQTMAKCLAGMKDQDDFKGMVVDFAVNKGQAENAVKNKDYHTAAQSYEQTIAMMTALATKLPEAQANEMQKKIDSLREKMHQELDQKK
jgi:tetratricopeptide (TPR) repeat protein